MGDDVGVCYHVDRHDVIVSVGGAWDRFARANDGADLADGAVLGRPLWDYISCPTTAHLYQQILGRVRAGRTARFTFRCDGTHHRRLLEMTITPGDDGAATFATRPVSVAEREPARLLARGEPRADEWLRICAWCARAAVGADAWAELGDAVGQLRLFEQGRLPRLTHGICPACLAEMAATITRLEPAT